MRTFFTCLLGLLCTGFSGAAGTFFADFESPPPRTRLYENAIVNPGGGLNDGGVLRLTPAEFDRLGTFVVNDLDAGRPVAAFDIRFQLQIGGGTKVGADGISVNVGPNLPVPINEGGTGVGLSLMFDTYVDDGKSSPELIALYHGKTIVRHPIPGMRTRNRFVDVNISMDAKGVLNVSFDSARVIKDLKVPGYRAVRSPQFGFGARTGGCTDNHLIDDLIIVTAGVGETLPVQPARPVALARSAERVWFMNGAEVLQGCVYKPPGDGPFPAIIMAGSSPIDLPEDGVVNPSPELGGLFAGKGYVLFLPGCYDLESEAEQIRARNPVDQDELLRALQEKQGRRLQSAMDWLRVQSFVHDRGIVVLGEGSGVAASLSGLSQHGNVRGMALFLTARKVIPSYMLPGEVSQAVAEAKCAMTLFHRPDAQDRPFLKALAAGLNARGAHCRILDQCDAGDAPMPPPSCWADDLFAFFKRCTL